MMYTIKMSETSSDLQSLVSRLEEFYVTNISLKEDVLTLVISLKEMIDLKASEDLIKSRFPEYKVNVSFVLNEESVKKFKKIIGIASGKGGVGKSMITLNLALALRESGYKVGILDADVYSPSIPGLLGVKENPKAIDGKLIDPVKTHGIELLSMGLFFNEGECQVWQPNLIEMVFAQFLIQANWDCDYLIIDFAGGMNAAFVACKQLCPNVEFLMITQANKMIYRDVLRMYALIKSMEFKVLGFIENMTEEFYSEIRLKQFEIPLECINRLMTIPYIKSFERLIEDGYPPHYLQTEESRYFAMLADIVTKNK